MVFCRNCGSQLTGSLKFCPSCGQATDISRDNINELSYENNKNSSTKIDNAFQEKGQNSYDDYNGKIVRFFGKYLGGHSSHPGKKEIDVDVLVDRNVIEIKQLALRIPYSSITDVGNMDQEKISALRVIGLGLIFLPLAIVGAMWKKKKLYTVIQYYDGMKQQALIFDFGKYMEEAQALIYQKTIQHKNNV
jgi:DNA-directed RNA polymerase subunit M/transcription elongation factor TFIIS